MKQTMRLQALLCLLLFAAPFGAAQDIAFWNVENYFDTVEDYPGDPFTPGGRYRWTPSRLAAKTRGIAKVVLALSDSLGEPPSVVGLCEVENAGCLKALVRMPALRKYGYRYVHYDSPDPRGIDCALLWRASGGSSGGSSGSLDPSADCPRLGRLRSSRAVPLRDSLGAVIPTRSLLVVEFDSLSIVVCHLPSKRGGSSEASRRRLLALRTLSAVCDSLASSDSGEFYPQKLAVHRPIVVVGDFNDTRTTLSDSLMAPIRELVPVRGDCSPGNDAANHPSAPGTIKFQGEWEQIDRAFVSPGLEATLRVAAPPFLQEPDKKYGGVKPRRTFSGPRYLGGLSDHLPIILTINLLYL